MSKNKNLGFTLAEVLIVIGIIGVVAALTLPNLNHATGDKETVTRLQKAYSILNEANDRAVAIYGPISTWKSNEQCDNDFAICWMKRIGEFLKISKTCYEEGDEDTYVSCDALNKGDILHTSIIHELSDGITFGVDDICGVECDCTRGTGGYFYASDVCIKSISVDINGPNKSKNKSGQDIFRFMLSDSKGILPYNDGWISNEKSVEDCFRYNEYECTFWVLEFGNLDYLKADSSGKCNDSNIILDGVTNTSCH